jgi:hypothetical protein
LDLRLLEGYILNHHLHWYTIRRFVYAERIYNLDSSKELPEWISPLYLDLTLQQAKLHGLFHFVTIAPRPIILIPIIHAGYSVFVVSPMDDAAVSGLPPCDAADFAVSLSLPNSRYGHETSVRLGEQVNHVALESTSTSTSSSSLIQPSITEREQLSAVRQPPLSKRRQQDDVENGSSGLLPSVEALREHRNQRRRLASGEFPKSSRSPSLSSKGASSSSALDIDLTEEDQVASAITESLQASNLRDTLDELQTVKVSSAPREDSPDDIIIVEPGLKIAPPSSMVAQRNSECVSRRAQSMSLDSTSKSRTKARNSLEESADDDELRAALAASLLDIPLTTRSSSITNNDKVEEVNSDEDHEQDDSPSMEELRKRRLARFGSTN